MNRGSKVDVNAAASRANAANWAKTCVCCGEGDKAIGRTICAACAAAGCLGTASCNLPLRSVR